MFAVLAPTVSGSALPPTTLPQDVRIGGVDVSGLRPYMARRAVRARFHKPLRIAFSKKVWIVSPELLTGSAAIASTVERAVHAQPGARLRLPVAVHGEWLRRYVDYLDRFFSRQPVSARFLGLQGLRPRISAARYGLRVNKGVMLRRITRALERNRRVPISLSVRSTRPAKLKTDFTRLTIVIRRASNRLYLYRGEKFWRSLGVATGSPYYPTPLGNFKIVDMQRWPAWYPPASDWARGLSPIPPGPNNPLGTRWMGLNVYGVGIHGTPDAASIGYSASHGCIRMRIPDAEWLFDRVHLGTPVYIVDA